MSTDPSHKRAPAISLTRLARAASTVSRVISALGLVVSTALTVAGSHIVPQYAGVVLLVTAPAYAGRLLVQGTDKYCTFGALTEAERRLRRLYLWSIGLLFVWVATGIVFLRWHSAVLEILAVGGLWALATWNACAVVDALPAAKRRRGTAALRDFQWVKKTRRLMAHSGLLKDLEKKLSTVTPETDTSSFFDRLSIVLVGVIVVLLPFASVEAEKHLAQWASPGRAVTSPGRAVAKRDAQSSSKRARGHAGHQGASNGEGSAAKQTGEGQSRGAHPYSVNEPGTSAVVKRVEAEPSFQQQCPGALRSLTGDSEDPVTLEVAESMLQIWEYEGATQAGCPGRARHVAEQAGVWYAVGTCGGSLRTLVVYVPGQGSTIQYQEPARFGLKLAQEGRLMNASSRGEVDGGDFYLFQTPEGTYAMARSRSATGTVTARSTNLWCERFSSTNVKYQRTGPEATRVWRAVNEAFGLTWPVRQGSSTKDQVYMFISSALKHDVANAVCSSLAMCTAWAVEGRLPAVSRADVTLEEMLLLAKQNGTHG
jgi:hypothetical protein